jgi:hypothetical protein
MDGGLGPQIPPPTPHTDKAQQSITLYLVSADIVATDDGPGLACVYSYRDGRPALSFTSPLSEDDVEAIRAVTEAKGRTILDAATDFLAREGVA